MHDDRHRSDIGSTRALTMPGCVVILIQEDRIPLGAHLVTDKVRLLATQTSRANLVALDRISTCIAQSARDHDSSTHFDTTLFTRAASITREDHRFQTIEASCRSDLWALGAERSLGLFCMKHSPQIDVPKSQL